MLKYIDLVCLSIIIFILAKFTTKPNLQPNLFYDVKFNFDSLH